MNIAGNSYHISKALPGFEKMMLGNQICRSAFSIASNIAEGSSRKSAKDQSRFIDIAIGSAYELETQLKIALEFECTGKILIADTLCMLEEELKMLHGFNRSLGEKS